MSYIFHKGTPTDLSVSDDDASRQFMAFVLGKEFGTTLLVDGKPHTGEPTTIPRGAQFTYLPKDEVRAKTQTLAPAAGVYPIYSELLRAELPPAHPDPRVWPDTRMPMFAKAKLV
jgi:hypothetical protein